MNSIAMRAGAIAIAVGGAIHPQESAAEVFNGAAFAGWTTAQQDSFIHTSVTMAGVVATRTKPSVAECIDGWYRPDTDLKDQRNDEVRQIIIGNPEYHPSGVILAVLIKKCGEFK